LFQTGDTGFHVRSIRRDRVSEQGGFVWHGGAQSDVVVGTLMGPEYL
jgi:hypothetical protein